MIIGVADLNKHFDKLSKVELRAGIEKGISLVQEAAKANCNGFKLSSGELKESVYTSLKSSTDDVVGICYTNKKYAPYVEFGTGPKGQAHHEGISPDIAVAYTQSPWWIPEGSGGNEIDKETADFYHMPRYTHHLDGYLEYEKTFRYTEGQPAMPFMYPALKDNEKEIVRLIGEEIKKQL
ncbi:hypothetical protein PMF13cell1_05645 [Blautia producta]|uniref:HK97 gp10 family phage protein n=1 Tax=Blautia producta TaxID=33035 RepID=A0A4V0Z8E8_9FIRM|nr:HK97-gp10 family putative phage morphogenesis protein [Blautia producta]QBF00049.1 hypothetical protein PMF13cell1_05645 [Blautia producta]